MPYRDPAAQREYQRRWKAERRAAFFAGRVCERCGTDERLELHHRDGTKESHKIWSWKPSRQAEELAKCIVLCRDCHEDEHWPRSMPRSPRLFALVREAEELSYRKSQRQRVR